jgi:hypothetical protein
MLAAGTQIGRYEVTRKLAEGGMAEIFLARAIGPEGFSKDVVIKVVRSFLATDPQFVQMFIAEARLASRLNHANVVQIFDFGKHDDTYYLAMEYVRGASLWDLKQRCRADGVPFPATLAAELGAQIARGLHYAHTLSDRGQKLGVVHRDVTPHNVLLSFDGAVKLTDFGIAKATSTHTAPGMLKGKFAYMSPEQARGEPVDARTDIFALGIVLWELLTGGRLFDGDSELAVLRAVEGSVIAPPARLNPDVPPDLSDIVMKALARPLPERFQSAFEFERALATWVLRSVQAVEDTSVALFLQQLYRAELDEDARPGTPARGAAAVSRAPDDAGLGDTLAVDRARQHAAATPRQQQVTMTMTPVREAPRSATPRPRDVTDPSLTATVEVSDLEGQAFGDPTGPGARRGTEQMPAYKPGPPSRPPAVSEASPARPKQATQQYRPASRRLEPLPAPEPSVVFTREADERPPERSAATQSETETAAPDELPGPPPRSRAAVFTALGALAVLGVAAAGYLVAGPSAPAPAVEVTAAEAPPPPPTAVAREPAPPSSAVEAPPAQDLPPTAVATPDAGPGGVTPVVEVGAPQPTGAPRQPGPPAGAPERRARAKATLEVRAVPFAEVVVVGQKSVEVTGVKAFTVEAGALELVFKHPRRTKRQRVTVKPDETLRLSFDADEP